jgi:hypothetical protein
MSTVSDRIKTEALAGADYCDLILLETPAFQSLASSKALINVRSVPYLDINADFFFDRSLRATTIGNTSYGISGDMIFNPEEIQVVFFNKSLVSLAPLPDIYSLVETNQWDMENFLLYSEEIFSLTRTNGKNVYGTISASSQEDLIKIFWASSGMDFMKNEALLLLISIFLASTSKSSLSAESVPAEKCSERSNIFSASPALVIASGKNPRQYRVIGVFTVLYL